MSPDITRDPLVVLEPERVLDHELLLGFGRVDDTCDEPECRQGDDSGGRPGKTLTRQPGEPERGKEAERGKELHVVVGPVETTDVDADQRRDEPDEPQAELQRLLSRQPEPDQSDRRKWKQVSRRRRQRRK